MNALVGVPVKDSNRDGHISLAGGDKAGVSCAICHTVADGSVLRVNNRGSIGKITDGPAALVFDMGQFLAWGANTKAYYPNAQISYLGDHDWPGAQRSHLPVKRGGVRPLFYQ
jgi:hypothetical protein